MDQTRLTRADRNQKPLTGAHWDQKPLIGAYWAARKETHEESVARTLQFFKSISEEPSLNNWYTTNKADNPRGVESADHYWYTGRWIHNNADSPQEISMEAIGKRMHPFLKPWEGIPDPQSTNELGFQFSAWNGNADASAGLSIKCGLYALIRAIQLC